MLEKEDLKTNDIFFFFRAIFVYLLPFNMLTSWPTSSVKPIWENLGKSCAIIHTISKSVWRPSKN